MKVARGKSVGGEEGAGRQGAVAVGVAGRGRGDVDAGGDAGVGEVRWGRSGCRRPSGGTRRRTARRSGNWRSAPTRRPCRPATRSRARRWRGGEAPTSRAAANAWAALTVRLPGSRGWRRVGDGVATAAFAGGRRNGIIRPSTPSRRISRWRSAAATCSSDQGVGQIGQHVRATAPKVSCAWCIWSGGKDGQRPDRRPRDEAEEPDRIDVDQRAGRDHRPAGQRHADHEHVEQDVDRARRRAVPSRSRSPAAAAAAWPTARRAAPG